MEIFAEFDWSKLRPAELYMLHVAQKKGEACLSDCLCCDNDFTRYWKYRAAVRGRGFIESHNYSITELKGKYGRRGRRTQAEDA